jgi:hypothetical protein
VVCLEHFRFNHSLEKNAREFLPPVRPSILSTAFFCHPEQRMRGDARHDMEETEREKCSTMRLCHNQFLRTKR